MDLLDLEFNAGANWGFAQPHEKINMLVAIEEKVVVATALKAKIIDHVTDSFTFKLRLNLGVGDQVDNVFDELAESGADTVGGENHCPLTIFPLFAIGICISKRVQFILAKVIGLKSTYDRFHNFGNLFFNIQSGVVL